MSTASEPSLHSGSENRSSGESVHEEHAVIPEKPEAHAEEPEVAAKVEECFCSFFDQPRIPRTTLEEYHHDQLKENHLFANVLTLDKDDEQVCIETYSDDPSTSLLVTGFGMRKLSSLQNALKIEERKRLLELYKSQKPPAKEELMPESITSFTEFTPKVTSSKRSIETETELSTLTSDVSVQQDKVRYLMGLETEGWEGEAYPQEEDLVRHMFAKESEDKFVFAETATMKSAQLYLRTHRIFDFFQFIIAHLLSEAPENPISFILVLLNKILLYRAGTGTPPLLYERKHIQQLFKLMDRMNSGFIDNEQYVSGMTSLGICAYNKDPPLSEEGLVSRKVFVSEALEAETALFNDLIKRKWTESKQKLDGSYSGLTTTNVVRSYASGLNLIPSDFMKTGKQMKLPDGAEEG